MNKARTKEIGSPQFDDVLMIHIQIPNSMDIVPRPATDADKKRFPLSWQAYQTGKEPATSGWPLEEWAQITASELQMLKAHHIRSVQQLADVADATIHRLGPGAMGLKNRAQKFLKSQDVVSELEARLALANKRIAELEEGERAVKELNKPIKARQKRFEVQSRQ